jgi:phosphoribosylanthranilate isomerase
VQRVLVKICGITRREDAELAIAAGADLVGFVFVPGARRELPPEDALWVRELGGAERVGVFRDAPVERVEEIRRRLALDWVQLHGAEPDSFLEVLGERVIRRLPVAGAIDWGRVRRVAARCLPLFDPGAGAGVAWGWQALAGGPPGLRFGLAGGLDPENVAEAVRVVRPALVDVSSGVESAPGVKDRAKLRGFVAAARAAAAAPAGDDRAETSA